VKESHRDFVAKPYPLSIIHYQLSIINYQLLMNPSNLFRRATAITQIFGENAIISISVDPSSVTIRMNFTWENIRKLGLYKFTPSHEEHLLCFRRGPYWIFIHEP
jgi:hypothetical protein